MSSKKTSEVAVMTKSTPLPPALSLEQLGSSLTQTETSAEKPSEPCLDGVPRVKKIHLAEPKTQKAKGFKAICAHNVSFAGEDYRWPLTVPYATNVYLIQGDKPFGKDLQGLVLDHTNPIASFERLGGEGMDTVLFARPCPITPRHGFVESRKVRRGDINKVWDETKAEDPQGELIAMLPLEGATSGIITNAGITFGTGNDGATDGTATGAKQAFVPFPMTKTAYKYAFNWNAILPEDWGIKDTPYVEFVEHEGAQIAVQLRDGPEQTAAEDFIPKDMVVKGMLMWSPHNMTLLKWEKLVKQGVEANGGPDGLVVYIDAGLSSHWAVHPISQGVAVVSSHIPFVGEELKASGFVPTPLSPEDFTKLRDYMVQFSNPRKFYSLDDTVTNYEFYYGAKWNAKVAQTTAATWHAMSMWGNEEHLLRLRAYAVIMLARLSLGVVAGEDRHYGTSGPYRRRGRKADFKASKFTPNSALSRDIVISAVGNLPWKQMTDVQEKILSDFSASGWHRQYGGRKWATIARANLKLIKLIEKFVEQPIGVRWGRILLAGNRLLNLVHNGAAKPLGKVVDDYVLNTAAAFPHIALATPQAAHLALGDLEFFNPRIRRHDHDKEVAEEGQSNEDASGSEEAADPADSPDDLASAFAAVSPVSGRLLEDDKSDPSGRPTMPERRASLRREDREEREFVRRKGYRYG